MHSYIVREIAKFSISLDTELMIRSAAKDMVGAAQIRHTSGHVHRITEDVLGAIGVRDNSASPRVNSGAKTEFLCCAYGRLNFKRKPEGRQRIGRRDEGDRATISSRDKDPLVRGSSRQDS